MNCKFKSGRFLIPLLFCIIVISLMCTRSQAPKGPFTPDWQSLAQHNPAPDWFRDAKFGIYFHWGVYSVPAFANEWYPRNMYDKNSREYQHHIETYGDPSQFGYPDFVPQFEAENFNAEEWANLFAIAGARFAGPVAEHHDGFSMWNSNLTPWNAAEKGPKRDITGELANALRVRGLKLITTFHHARNNLWEKEGNWTGHYSFVKKNFPALLEEPEQAIMYGYMPREKFLKMWKKKLEEVIDKYQPDIMWFDSWLDEIPDSVKTEYLAWYFNRAHEWDKEVVVTYKQEDLPQNVGVLDLEKGRMGDLTPFPWLTDDTISKGSWCYTQNLEIKPVSTVLHSLIDIVSKNGVLLLNISPKADGTIPQEQQDVLYQMGGWLKTYGESIYGTRPWVTNGEGPTQLKAGHFGGFTDAGRYTAQDIRYTTKGDTIYAIFLGWPGAERKVTLSAFSKDNLPAGLEITDVSLLTYMEKIQWQLEDTGLIIRTPDMEPIDLAFPFKIVTQHVEYASVEY